jgi:alpha-mannosidase
MPGSWVFEYALIPHTGGWQTAFQQAYAFETPLRAMASGLHTGELPASGSFITHAPPEFAISALKAAEDGSGWVVRGCNPTGEPLAVQLSPHLPYAAAWRVNLAEERLAPLARGEDGTMRFTVRGCEVVTVRFDP